MAAGSHATGMSYQAGFATVSYELKIDGDLEFANVDDGRVTLTLTSYNAKPTGTNIDGATIRRTGKENAWTIGFEPASVQRSTDGGMEITVIMQWLANKKLSDPDSVQAGFPAGAKYNPIILSGLDFKVKEAADAGGAEVETSANATGGIDLHKKMQLWSWRAYCQTVIALPGQSEWTSYFGAEED